VDERRSPPSVSWVDTSNSTTSDGERREDRMACNNGNTDSGWERNFNPNCGANCVSKLDWVVHLESACLAMMI